MSTRATYQFISNGMHRPHTEVTFYIHHDGYESGAALYFWNMHHCKNKHGGLAERFLRANDRAELTDGHDSIGDTQYRYTLRSDMLTVAKCAYTEKARVWTNIYFGNLYEFINSNPEQIGQFEELRPIKDRHNNYGAMYATRSELVAEWEAACTDASTYAERFPQYVGNVSAKRDAVQRAYDAILQYDGTGGAPVRALRMSIKEIRDVIDTANWLRNDLTGCTREEFRKQAVGPRLREHIAKLQALVIPARFAADIEHARIAIERAETVIARWEQAQEPTVN